MLYSPGNHAQFAGYTFDCLIAKLDDHGTVPNQKHLILVEVGMPRKGHEEFHEFDFLAVEGGRDFGTPMLVEQREFGSQRYLGHSIAWFRVVII